VKLERIAELLEGVWGMAPREGKIVYEFIRDAKVRNVLELGFANGASTMYLAAAVDEVGGGSILTMDNQSARARKPNILDLMEKTGLGKYVTPVFADASYSWELMKLLEREVQPRFDFVFIDGAHTWEVDGLAFFVVDRFLRPGGWILFDDLEWTLGGGGMKDVPWVKELPVEQRGTPQIEKVFDLLVKRHPNYTNFRRYANWGWAQKKAEAGAEDATAAILDSTYDRMGAAARAGKFVNRVLHKIRTGR